MAYLSGHWFYIVILLVIVLIIWGPGKLPDVGAGLGRAIREFRKASAETHEAFTHAATTPVQPQPQPQPQQTSPAEPAAVEQPVGVTQQGGTTTDPHPQPTDTPPQTPVTR